MDPRLLALIGILFLGIGGFSFSLAQKRLRYARMLGQPAVWYKNLGLMTSIEYLLLGVIVFLNLSANIQGLPNELRAARDILYAGTLFLAIICLLTVVYLGFKKPRNAQPAPQLVKREANMEIQQSPEERAAEAQRKRERRQKAAAARRRHAGRA